MTKKSILLVVLAIFSLSCWAEVHYLTDAEFKAKIFDYATQKEWKYDGQPCVVDFYATWCGPCKRLAPIMDSLSNTKTYKGITFYKVDVDKESALAAAFGIRSIPQLLFIPSSGKPSIMVGLNPTTEVEKKLKGLSK